MQTQAVPYTPLPLRYLATIGTPEVMAETFTTYQDAETYVSGWRRNGEYARIDTQLQHCDGWQTHASRIWPA